MEYPLSPITINVALPRSNFEALGDFTMAYEGFMKSTVGDVPYNLKVLTENYVIYL